MKEIPLSIQKLIKSNNTDDIEIGMYLLLDYADNALTYYNLIRDIIGYSNAFRISSYCVWTLYFRNNKNKR